VSAVADKLREARALIERGWTQNDFARDERGDEVVSSDQTPTCYCALGAISEATVGFSNPDIDDLPGDIKNFDRTAKALSAALGARFSHEIAMWNETITRAHLLESLNRVQRAFGYPDYDMPEPLRTDLPDLVTCPAETRVREVVARDLTFTIALKRKAA
jgi:hypothetical protein